MIHDPRATEEQSTRKRANLLQLRYFDTRTLSKLPFYPDILSVDRIREYKSVVLSIDKSQITIAVTANSPQHALSDLKQIFQDYKISFVMMSDSGFKDFMNLYAPPEKVDYQDIEIKPGDETANIQGVSKTLDSVHSDDLFNYLIRQAKKLNSSDIHLETQEGKVRIRFRVDGVLHEIAEITYEKYRQLTSTIAVHANISSSSSDAQTGHMDHKILDGDKVVGQVNMRIETVPTNFGQDAVMRLFNIEHDLLDLSRLGLSIHEKEIISDIVAHPSGLVMSVGPTGSGKTTTLYSILNQLNTPERKIITLEDPVEYTLPGVVQIPVDTEHKDSFMNKLRAVLRLDPDVIMIGEIRDADTARTALQASLSGHLVLSTFHASDTTAALARIYEFLGDNPLLTSAIRLIVAQRLVRQLDDKSKLKKVPDENMMKIVNDELQSVQDEASINLDSAVFYGPGKSENAPFGYVGQTAIVELLTMTPDIEKLLHQDGANVSPDKIKQLAISNGMTTLKQNGLIKAVKGITSLDEIFRVVA